MVRASVEGKGPGHNALLEWRDSMKHVRKSVLLWYSPREMYDLVTGVHAYPQFLPWCDRAEVVDHHADGVTARLGLAYMGVHHAFTTRNTHHPDQSVAVKLVDGPFSKLEGTWLFQPLGRPGSDDGRRRHARHRLRRFLPFHACAA